jgi:dTMP kinase
MRSVKHLAGKFIVFDGGEGCGKSTQAALLRKDLEDAGLRVLAVHDPGATRIGEMIRAILLNPDNTDMAMRCEMLLYMAARAQMMSERIMARARRRAGRRLRPLRLQHARLPARRRRLTVDDIRAVAEIAIKGIGRT